VQKKYLEALKKFDELIVLKKEYFGDKSDSVSLPSRILTVHS